MSELKRMDIESVTIKLIAIFLMSKLKIMDIVFLVITLIWMCNE